MRTSVPTGKMPRSFQSASPIVHIGQNKRQAAAKIIVPDKTIGSLERGLFTRDLMSTVAIGHGGSESGQ
jgi:hypothetical protein